MADAPRPIMQIVRKYYKMSGQSLEYFNTHMGLAGEEGYNYFRAPRVTKMSDQLLLRFFQVLKELEPGDMHLRFLTECLKQSGLFSTMVYLLNGFPIKVFREREKTNEQQRIHVTSPE